MLAEESNPLSMHRMKWFSQKYGAILLINMDDIGYIKLCFWQNKSEEGGGLCAWNNRKTTEIFLPLSTVEVTQLTFSGQ